MPGKAILHREPQLLEPQQPDGIGNPPLQFAADLFIDPAVDDGQTVHKGIHGLTPIDGCIDRVARRTGDMGETVVAPGTPDAVRHHDPRKDRQRGPARRVHLGPGRGGFKRGAAGCSDSPDADVPELTALASAVALIDVALTLWPPLLILNRQDSNLCDRQPSRRNSEIMDLRFVLWPHRQHRGALGK